MNKLFFLIFISSVVIGQNTFNEVIDIDPESRRNFGIDIAYLDNYIYVTSTQNCSVTESSCAVISKVNLEGEIIKYITIDSVYSGLENNLTIWDNRLYVTAFRDNKTYLYELNEELNVLDIDTFIQNSESIHVNQGNTIIDSFLYVYGQIDYLDNRQTEGLIIKMDGLTKNIIWQKKYLSGEPDLNINGLQKLSANSLAFIIERKSFAGPTGINGHKVVKINTYGEILDTFSFEDNRAQENRLLVSANGEFYFGSGDDPIDSLNYSVQGRINKISNNFSSLEWFVVPPFHLVLNTRVYKYFDYIEAQNGDILVCGYVYDNSDTEHPEGFPDENYVWNGFILRLTPSGEVVWLRIYRNPNVLVPIDGVGDYRPSVLNRMKELDDGSIIAVGDVLMTSGQYVEIDLNETEFHDLWLLKVDANGCLESIPCDTLNYLTNVNQVDVLNDIVIYPNPVDDIMYFNDHGLDIKEYKIINLSGLVVSTNPILDGLIDVSNLKTGCYFIQLINSNEIIKTTKFLKL